MSNLTIAVDDNIIKQARVRAIQQGTSVSAKVREFLTSYASGVTPSGAKEPTSDLMRLMAQVRDEIRSNELATDLPVQTSHNMPEKALTLREEMYQGDFRARDRLASTQGTPAPTGTL